MSKTKSEISTIKQFVLDEKSINTTKIFHFNKTPLRDVIIGNTSPSANVSYENRLSSKFHILEYIIGGDGELVIGQKKFKLKPNQTVFIQKGTVHTIHSNPSNPIEKIWIAFSCNYLNSMIIDFSIPNGSSFVDTFSEFQTISHLSEINADFSTVILIVEALHAILSNISANKHNESLSDNLLSYVKVKLDTMLYGKGTLDDIAAELSLSKATIIRMFKKAHNGITPYKYLLDKKLNMAKEYLKSSKISIKNIALMFSFTDEHYFTYLFTKKNGISPSDYRKQFSAL